MKHLDIFHILLFRSFYRQGLYECALKRKTINEMRKNIEMLFNFLAQETTMKQFVWLPNKILLDKSDSSSNNKQM